MDVEKEVLGFFREWAGANTWVIQVFAVVFFALLLDFIQRKLLTRLHLKLQRTRNPWDDALVMAAARPLSLLIWVVGISFAADIVQLEAEAAIFKAVPVDPAHPGRAPPRSDRLI